MMKSSKPSTSFLVASLLLCTVYAAGLLIPSTTVLATANPIKGIGVVVKKNPGGSSKAAEATTNDDGKFTIGNLVPGSYTVSLKHAGPDRGPKSDSSLRRTAVLTIEGVRGGKVEKRVPISELQTGVIIEIEIVGTSAATITGTCIAINQEGLQKVN